MWHSSLLSDVCVTLILLRAIQINFIIITINMMLKRTFGVSWATWELYVAVSFIYGTLKDIKKSFKKVEDNKHSLLPDEPAAAAASEHQH